MRPSLRALVLSACLTAACTGTGSQPEAGVPFPTGLCSEQGWCWELPGPQGEPIAGLYASDRERVWVAAGNKVLRHDDGAGWTVAYEAPGRITDLRGTSPSDLWLATTEGMARWRGETWELVPWPGAAALKQLRPLDGGGAVAFDGRDDYAEASGLWRWDGQEWSRDPYVSGCVPAAYGASGDDLWTITGHRPRLMIDPPLLGSLAHWDGSQWNEGSPSEEYEVEDLWADGSEVWAVARPPATVPYAACVLLRQQGARWIREHEILEGWGGCAVWAGSAKDIWMLSTTKIAHWDGQAWTEADSPVEGDPVRLWGSAGTVWASGGARVARLDGGAWSALLSPRDLYPEKTLQALWCGASEPVAAGAGMILTRSEAGWGVSWEGQETVAALWGPPGSDDLWAVGSDGLILRRSLGVWTRQPSGTSEPLHGVWGRNAMDVYAVGRGTLLHFDGAAWRALPSPDPGDLLAIWGAPTGELLVAKANGRVVTNPKTAQGGWAPVSSPASKAGKKFRRVSFWSDRPSNVWLVWEGYPEALRWDGRAFTPAGAVSGFTQPSAVWATSERDVYLTGYDSARRQSALAHWDGASWTVEAIGTSSEARGICGVPGRGLWVVGGEGARAPYRKGDPAMILRRDLTTP